MLKVRASRRREQRQRTAGRERAADTVQQQRQRQRQRSDSFVNNMWACLFLPFLVTLRCHPHSGLHLSPPSASRTASQTASIVIVILLNLITVFDERMYLDYHHRHHHHHHRRYSLQVPDFLHYLPDITYMLMYMTWAP